MWFIPDNNPSCTDADNMLQDSVNGDSDLSNAKTVFGLFKKKTVTSSAASGGGGGNSSHVRITERCCLAAPHWNGLR